MKPVLPDVLLANVGQVLAGAGGLRSRSAAARARTAQLVSRSNQLIAKSQAISAALESVRRPCPTCAGPLDWVERSLLSGVEYDYYRGCASGCGLFCFDLQARKWVKLA